VTAKKFENTIIYPLNCVCNFVKKRLPIQNSFCWVLRGAEREGAEWVVREGVGAGGRNEPSLVCTYE
jgi:hypothetical protein